MAIARRTSPAASFESVRVTNPDGAGAYVFTCDHASNFLPDDYAGLGLHPEELSRHIAWDPGALPVAARLAAALDAPLIETRISRLVLDCNRPLDAPDLIPPVSETTAIPGNTGLSQAAREARITRCWKPFHDAVAGVVEARLARGQETRLVSVHSYTPVYKGARRPWQIGIIHDDDTRLATPLIDALRRRRDLAVGVNEPYSPADRVYFTLERHARSRGLACAMIEIRNDEVVDRAAQERWAVMLAGIFREIEPARLPMPPPARSKQSVEGIT